MKTENLCLFFLSGSLRHTLPMTSLRRHQTAADTHHDEQKTPVPKLCKVHLKPRLKLPGFTETPPAVFSQAADSAPQSTRQRIGGAGIKSLPETVVGCARFLLKHPKTLNPAVHQR
jgi:hypothetical protein